MENYTIEPLGDKVVIEPIETEEITEGGVYIPDNAKEKPERGLVLAVGPGRIGLNNERLPMPVKEGDIVIFAKYAGSQFKFNSTDEKSYVLLSEEDIIAKLVEVAEHA